MLKSGPLAGTVVYDRRSGPAGLGFGKRLPTAVYVLREEKSDFGPTINRLIGQVVAAFEIGPEFNVLKFRTDELKLSFLSYPDFFDAAHPSLRKAVTLDLRTGKVRQTDYGRNPNPPILHRKESFFYHRTIPAAPS